MEAAKATISNFLRRLYQITTLKRVSGTPEEQERSADVDNLIKKQNEVQRIGVVLYGQSGKQTILRRIQLITGHPFNTSSVYKALVDSISILLAQQTDSWESAYTAQNVARFYGATGESSDSTFTLLLPSVVRELWQTAEIRELYRLSKDDLDERTQYFLDSAERICNSNYIRIKADVVNIPEIYPGDGVRYYNSVYDSVLFSVLDFQDEQKERKVGNMLLANTHVLLFCVDLSDYDTTVDTSKNRMTKTITWFEHVVNDVIFKNTKMFLLFTNKDLFEKKLSRVPLNQIFINYEGGEDVQAAIQFIRAKFEAVKKAEKPVDVFYINSDPENDGMEDVLKEIIKYKFPDPPIVSKKKSK